MTTQHILKRRIIIVKGYSKTETELENDRKIIELYKDYFSSCAGGVFNKNKEIIVLEEPEATLLENHPEIHGSDYLIVVLLGHGANKDGHQVFQLSEHVIINPGQIQFPVLKQLFIIESCRNVFTDRIEVQSLNNLIPKFKYGGRIDRRKTKEEALNLFNREIVNSDQGTTYLFACNVGEAAYEYFFIEYLIRVAVYLHEYSQHQVFYIDNVFEQTRKQVVQLSGENQHPVILGIGKRPFVLSII